MNNNLWWWVEIYGAGSKKYFTSTTKSKFKYLTRLCKIEKSKIFDGRMKYICFSFDSTDLYYKTVKIKEKN